MPSCNLAENAELSVPQAATSTPQAGSEAELVLVVEPDTLLREILVAGLGLGDRRLRVVAVAQPEGAMRVLETNDVNLVITELVFPAGLPDGDAYLDQLRSMAPRVPILAFSAERASIVRLRSRVDALLRKPAEMDDLLRTVQALLRRRRESVVRGLALETFLQMVQLERKSCTVTASVRGRQGRVWLRAGRVIEVEAEGLRGKEALFLLLTWIAPVLSVIDVCDTPGSMDAAVQELLLEHFVNEDHTRRD